MRHGVAAGVLLFVGYVLQTVGLQYTSPSTSAFITYLLVVFVPLISFAVAAAATPSAHPGRAGPGRGRARAADRGRGRRPREGRGLDAGLRRGLRGAHRPARRDGRAPRPRAPHVHPGDVRRRRLPRGQPGDRRAADAVGGGRGRRVHGRVRHRPRLLRHGVGAAGGEPVPCGPDPAARARVRRAVGVGHRRRPVRRCAGRRHADPGRGRGRRGGAAVARVPPAGPRAGARRGGGSY